MKLSDLPPNKENPRKISEDKLKMLSRSLETFGDLGGFLFNEQDKTLYGGHMRQKVLPPEANIVIEKRYDPPTKTGTVAEGYVEVNGERHKYRAVRWDKTKARAAAIAANAHGGEWDLQLLPDWILDIDQANWPLDTLGFDEQELANLMAPLGQTSNDRPSMQEKFGVPPFSVLDARQGYWQDRKRQWLALGIKSEIGRKVLNQNLEIFVPMRLLDMNIPLDMDILLVGNYLPMGPWNILKESLKIFLLLKRNRWGESMTPLEKRIRLIKLEAAFWYFGLCVTVGCIVAFLWLVMQAILMLVR